MKDKTLHSKRSWLNPADSCDTGMISSCVHVSEYHIGCDVSIWDCSRKISLDFGCYNREDAIERAKKLNIIISQLEVVREAMGEAYTIAEGGGLFEKGAIE